jgi:hypothetical protein
MHCGWFFIEKWGFLIGKWWFLSRFDRKMVVFGGVFDMKMCNFDRKMFFLSHFDGKMVFIELV